MSTEPTRARRSFAGMLATIAVGFVLACNQSEAAPPRGGSGPENAPEGVAKPRHATENYIAEMKAVGECKTAKECVVEVTLEALGAYKVNDQYPHKLKLGDPPPDGVTYPKPLLKKEDGKWDDKKKGSFRVPFVAAKAGKAKISGVLSFSVCSDANCLMEKQPLELDVDVK